MLNYTAMYHGDTELSRLYRGGTLLWENPPAPSWDETRIAVVKLDLDDEITDEIEYFDTWESALIWMEMGSGRLTADRFLARFGNEYPASTISSGMRNSQYLKHVKISGGNVTTISGYAFGGNVNLESIDFGDTVQTIDGLALYKMGKLVDVKIGSGITSIASSAFSTTTRYAPWTGYVNSITIDKPEGSISGAPWGATNATVTWTG